MTSIQYLFDVTLSDFRSDYVIPIYEDIVLTYEIFILTYHEALNIRKRDTKQIENRSDTPTAPQDLLWVG